MPTINPTDCALRALTISGANLRSYCQCIQVWETVCKPYLQATITIIDNNNVINSLKLRGGERVSFVIDSGFDIYESVQYVLSVDEPPEQPDNFRTKIYTIQTASESFFNDRASMVQRSDVNVPATTAAQLIHSEFISGDAPLNVLMASLGMLAQTNIGGYITANKKPFTAIREILNRASFPGFPSGTPMYFRNRNEYVMAPLEMLFATMGSQETFVQKNTWGAHWQDTFTSANAIIQVQTKVNEQDDSAGGRGGMSNLAQAAQGALNVFDITQGKEQLMQAATAAAAIAGSLSGAASQFARGKYGGIANVLQLDSRRNSPSTDQSLNAVAENMFKAAVKDGTQYLVRVPFQTGVHVTCGKGVTLKLLAPVGDLDQGYSMVGGNLLAADVSHECFFDNRERKGTTIIRACSIGFAA